MKIHLIIMLNVSLLLTPGLIIFAAGFWSRTALVSHITNFVDAGQRATFYSLIAIIEQLASFMGKNVVQIAWQKAIQWKGYLLGFPFMILTVSLLYWMPILLRCSNRLADKVLSLK